MTEPSCIETSPFLNEDQLASRWQLKSATLRKWRSQRTGPKYVKVGGRIRYLIDDVLRYEQPIYPIGRSK